MELDICQSDSVETTPTYTFNNLQFSTTKRSFCEKRVIKLTFTKTRVTNNTTKTIICKGFEMKMAN